MVDNPGKPAGIYNIPALVAKAFPRAMTVENITSGFRVTGIFPHNADVFPDEAFLPAQVTDRPQPEDQMLTAATADRPTTAASAIGAADSSDVDKQPGQQAATSLESEQPQIVTSCDVPVLTPPTDAANLPTTADSTSLEPFAGTSDSDDADKQPGPQATSSLDCEQLLQQSVTSPDAQVSVSPPCEPGLFSPKEIRPFPSAPPRKVSGRRTGKTRILTDTPVKNELAQRQRQKARKGSSEKESVGQVPSCSTALFGSSQKRSVARGKKKAAKKPSVADAEKDDPPCLYCGELYSESRKELRHWIRCEGSCEKWAHALCAGTSAQDKHFVCEICLSN